MKRLSMRIAGPAFLFALALGTSYSGNVSAASCLGICGSQAATDGVVTGAALWITTAGGLPGVGELSGIGGTNGSSFTTSTFSANANTLLNFNFNYVTSDGFSAEQDPFTIYADYASVQLFDSTNSLVATLLTARTEPSGNIIPGFGLPSINAILTPGSALIHPGVSNWSPLGGYSTACYGPGCGYTDWVNSQYTIANAGTYYLVFAVTNFVDTLYDSGLAFSALTIGGQSIDTSTTPLPAALPLFASALGALGLLGWRRKRKNAAAITA